MRAPCDLAARSARSPISVLLLGETGVGKELMAQAIHRLSPRADGPFVAVNATCLPESLAEAELFGHEKGAFTGATEARPGLLEASSGGTLFLDEVGEMPTWLQTKLLRVIETREVLRVGAVRTRRVDVRFVAATHRDLHAEVGEGRFRKDFLFRLNAFEIRIPPLRERTSELGVLAASLLAQANGTSGRPEAARLTEDAMRAIESHDWPGNVRELKNALESAVLLCDDGLIRPHHLRLRAAHAPPFEPASVDVPAHPDTFEAAPAPRDGDERARILEALRICAGNQCRAAELLGIARRTLVERLDRYQIPRPKKGAAARPAAGLAS
jgi:DNA-binding NtrC family response regulator